MFIGGSRRKCWYVAMKYTGNTVIVKAVEFTGAKWVLTVTELLIEYSDLFQFTWFAFLCFCYNIKITENEEGNNK